MDRQQNAWTASSALVTKDWFMQTLAMKTSVRPEAPSRMVSSWNNTAVDQANRRPSATAKVLNAAAHNVSESAHHLVDGAAHVAHSMLDRVLGHHRAVHDELLEKSETKLFEKNMWN